MRPAVAVLLLLLTAAPAAADLKKSTHGLLLGSDCDQEICRAYTLQVTKKFVRMPIKRQLVYVQKFCSYLDEEAEKYEDLAIDVCIFQYLGEDILYRGTDGKIYAEGAYIAALAALRD